MSAIESFDPLGEEVKARPTFAYRLLEILARSGWRIVIDRRGVRPRIVADRDDLHLEESGESVADAAARLFRAALQ